MFTGPTASPLEPELPAILNWLRDLPPSGDAAMTSPQPDAANWNQWWLRASRRWHRRINGPHPLYRRLVKPQVIDRIDQPQLRAAHRIVHAVVACACANEPHLAALAGQLVHDSAGAGIKLSDIQKTLQQVPVRRRQAGLLSKPAPTPEAITRILDGHRIACQADCGQLQRPEAMRRTFAAAAILEMGAATAAKVWYADRRQTRPGHGPQYRPDTAPPREHELIERNLVSSLAPDDPLKQSSLYGALPSPMT